MSAVDELRLWGGPGHGHLIPASKDTTGDVVWRWPADPPPGATTYRRALCTDGVWRWLWDGADPVSVGFTISDAGLDDPLLLGIAVEQIERASAHWGGLLGITWEHDPERPYVVLAYHGYVAKSGAE